MEKEIKKMSAVNKSLIALTVMVIIACLLLLYKFNVERSTTDIRLLGDQDVTLEVGNEYQEAGFVASTNAKDMSDKVIVTSNVDTKSLGTYKVLYNLKIDYLNYNKTLSRNVYIQDTTKPTLTVDSKKEFTHYIGDKYSEPKYTAIDNYDGDITKKVKVKSNVNPKKRGTYQITYEVADSSGNTSTDKVTVHVKRKKNPYIVVSISKQKLWYYEYDKLVLTSNVVTGINGKTPRGSFRVQSKATNIVLKGEDYESFVNYWIGFYRGAFGFHDASWRSSFGGTIYKNHGSHGCVNMPYSKVRQLYNMVDYGTPVYIRS